MRISRKCLNAIASKVVDSLVAQALEHYSAFRPASLTMKQYLDFGRNGTPTSSYCFLKTELLVRMANIMKEFDLLPPKLLATPSARLVSDWYKQSFEELLYFKNNEPTVENRLKFNDKLRTILQRHSTVVETMAEALLELKETSGIDMASERNIQYFLDRFYLNRISIRMLQSQHLAIFESSKPEHPEQVGYIDPACNVREIVVDAYENARTLCEQYYGDAPSLRLKCVNTKFKAENELENATGEDNEIRVALVPLHLYYIMFELLKNSMRATIDHKKGRILPDINVSVILGQETLSIKVSDQGGGVPQRKMEHLFHYLYSTAPQPRKNAKETPFAGYGYGLPISRLYARYFLGDLSLFSMEGFGTDACVHFKGACPLGYGLQITSNILGQSSRRCRASAVLWNLVTANFIHVSTSARLVLPSAQEQREWLFKKWKYGYRIRELREIYNQYECRKVATDRHCLTLASFV